MNEDVVSEVDVKIEVKTEREEVGERGELDAELRVSSEVMRASLGGGGGGGFGGEGAASGGEDGGGYCCSDCGNVYKTSCTLSCHRRLRHPDKGDAAASARAHCTVCDKWYPSRVSFEKHRRYQHLNKARCRTCYRNFQTPVELTKHQIVCKQSVVTCPHCSKVYKSEVSLRNHVKYKHPARTEHWCASCRRAFSSARALVNHAANLHAPAATVCHTCAPPRVFPSAAALRSHNLYRHTPGCSRCHHCCKMFATPASLDRHRAKNHGGSDTDKRDDDDDEYTSDMPE
ncbi:hypothetical protein O0L34_g2422 [Tuta absoluta]|nr:hypothetical protein O0L34_g2422 [Tuta absoluta]